HLRGGHRMSVVTEPGASNVFVGLLTSTRAMVFRHLDDVLRHSASNWWADPPVYRYLPDDVAAMTCVIVGRPSLDQGATAAVRNALVPVNVLGIRVSADEHQAELDAATDEVYAALGMTGSPVTVTRVEPVVLNVAGTDWPAYTLSTTTEVLAGLNTFCAP